MTAIQAAEKLERAAEGYGKDPYDETSTGTWASSSPSLLDSAESGSPTGATTLCWVAMAAAAFYLCARRRRG